MLLCVPLPGIYTFLHWLSFLPPKSFEDQPFIIRVVSPALSHFQCWILVLFTLLFWVIEAGTSKSENFNSRNLSYFIKLSASILFLFFWNPFFKCETSKLILWLAFTLNFYIFVFLLYDPAILKSSDFWFLIFLGLCTFLQITKRLTFMSIVMYYIRN